MAHPEPRIYDYLLGGKDNFAADREAAEMALQAYPQLAEAVQSNRAFLARAVRYLTGEAGIRQFLDVGTGIPAANNTHQVAQREAPETKIVYVDNDPIVLTHARALLTSTPQGACAYIQADLHDPDAILAEAAKTLDLSQPTALMLLAVLQFIPAAEDPYALVARLVGAALPVGQLPWSSPTPTSTQILFLNPQPGRVHPALQRQAQSPQSGHAARPGGDRPVLRRAGADRARCGSRWPGGGPDGDLTASRPSSMWCAVGRKP